MNAAAWVHPSDGFDEPDLDAAMTYANDPSQKFRTLQRAIDMLQLYLVDQYHAVSNPDQQGIVYALPGTYGPTTHGPASGDVLPIVMRDRVHVQGLGARRCTIRGAGTSQQSAPNGVVNWPTQSAASATASVELLLTYRNATVDMRTPLFHQALPWLDGSSPHRQGEDTPETLDGFTLTGSRFRGVTSRSCSPIPRAAPTSSLRRGSATASSTCATSSLSRQPRRRSSRARTSGS